MENSIQYPRNFDKKLNSTREGVEYLCKIFNIEDYEIIKHDGKYYVSVGLNKYRGKSIVDLSGKTLEKLTGIKNFKLDEIPMLFLEVKGMFDISDNNITELIGAPEVVCRFNCSNNNIKYLDYGPYEFFDTETLYKGFSRKEYVNRRKEDRKKGSKLPPDYYTGEYDCSNNQIVNYGGLPNIINNLICYGNPKKFTMIEWQKSVSDEAGELNPPRYVNGKEYADDPNNKDIIDWLNTKNQKDKRHYINNDIIDVSNILAKSDRSNVEY